MTPHSFQWSSLKKEESFSVILDHISTKKKKSLWMKDLYKGNVKYWSGSTVGIRASLDIIQLTFQPSVSNMLH